MTEKLKILLSLSSEISKEKDIKKILIILTNITKSLLNADICSIFLHDKKNRELWTIIAYYIKEIRIRDDKGIAGYVFQTGEMLNIKNAYEDDRFSKDIDMLIGYKTQNVLAIPLFSSEKEPIGVVEVINKLDNSFFSEEDIELLNHLVLYINSIIDNALLVDQLKETHRSIIFKLSNMTRYKDPETENHTKRVGLYCLTIGKHLGFDEGTLETLQLASMMHDIGKIGVPDIILLKPEKLSESEWDTMKKHTIIGNEILKGDENRLSEIASIIALEHHEKWNGSGYPYSKKGEDITIFGRITSIADVFDALISKRPYKTPWSFNDAVEYISSQRGEHFDPKLVDIFISSIPDFKLITEENKD